VQLAKCWKHRESGATTSVVTMRPVRSISRKGRRQCNNSSVRIRFADVVVDNCWRRNPQRPHASHLTSTSEVKIWSEPHGDMGNTSSEIPCRVSSDLHEWRNDFPTVSTTDSAKLKYE
jgi:hypothetical protein